MLNIVYGGFGIYKSEYLYKKAIGSLDGERQCFFVVPEQEALSAEKKIYELSCDVPSLGLQVLNFQKLCEEVFRKCGGLAGNYINDSAKKLLLKKAVADLSPALSVFAGKADDDAFISEMLMQISEFKYAAVSPTHISEISKRIDPESGSLAQRLSDISLIYTAFNTLVSQSYADPQDDLSRCAEYILTDKPIIDTPIFFDSFNGFTAQQFSVIYSLLKTGNDITVSLCLPSEDDKRESGIYSYTLDTEATLLKLCENAGVKVNKIVLSTPTDYADPDLDRLAREFSVTGKVCSKPSDGGIKAISCANIFDECETVAALIAEKIRHGARFGDIAIITRSAERYKGIIDAVLERHDIPVFFSVRTDITEKALIRYILTALTICTSQVRYTDVISNIRCGLSPLTDFECDILESYAAAWKLRGKIWWDEDGFKMNPRGYVPLTERDNEALLTVNDIRTKLMTPLESFKASLRSSKSVTDYCRAIYSFLIKADMTKKLAVRSERMEKRGEKILAGEETAIWGALCKSLDILCTTLGELECTCDEFIKYFKLLLSDVDIGSIPQSDDVVTVGDAALFRAGDTKHAYLIGCEDGMFPQSVSEPRLLSMKDRKILGEFKLDNMEFDPTHESSMEFFHFIKSAVLPTHSLTLTYSRKNGSEDVFPSFAFARICNMFEGIKCGSESLPMSDRIFSAEALSEYTPYLESKGFGEQIREFTAQNRDICKNSALYDIPVSTTADSIPKSTVNALFPRDLHLSQSATDSFTSCPFAYHCKYSLKLSEKTDSTIKSRDTGTLTHSVLQGFLESIHENGELKTDALTDEIISEKICAELKKRASLILDYTSEDKRARVEHMLDRISEIASFTAKHLVDEFKQSGFEPTFFELPIKDYGDSALIPMRISLEDGSYIILGGICDRVDTMYKNGKLYVRVADYKTGNNSFNLENIRVGQGLQLLIYLFSIWENATSKFKGAAKAPSDAEIIPAAAEYVMTTPKQLNTSVGADIDDISEALSRSFKRSGIYLSDKVILEDMDRGLTSKYIPVSSKLNSKAGVEVKSLEELNDLKHELSEILTEIGNSIKQGHASASPLPADKKAGREYSACEFCAMKPVCKNTSNVGNSDADEEY